jgi:zinc transport system permease protein
MIEALTLPFMQRALLAGLLVGVIASLLGVFVILRRAAFFGDAIAHASLAGVALGVLGGIPPLLTAAAVAVAIGSSLHRLERHARLSLDAILGFVLPFFMALGVLILSAVPGYQPELLSYLFGSLLTVSWERLAAVTVIAVLVAAVLIRDRHRLVFAAFDADGAQVAGIRVGRLLTQYHVLLALAVIASLSTVGIVLANALLVIPAATAKLLARSLAQMFWLAPLVGTVSVVVGLAAAYRLDLPSGPAIVVVAGLLFLAAWSARTWRGSRGTRR